MSIDSEPPFSEETLELSGEVIFEFTQFANHFLSSSNVFHMFFLNFTNTFSLISSSSYRGLTILTSTPSSSSNSPLPLSHLLVSTLPTSQLLSPICTSNQFKNVTPLSGSGVNLRGFGNQGGKYGRISDVIIYSRDGFSEREGVEGREGLIRCAERVKEAMKNEERKDGRKGGYTIFVVVG